MFRAYSAVLARNLKHAVTLALGLALAGCGAASGAAKPPELPADRYAKCSIKASQSKPLIVEWPSTDRASLESIARRGLVAVRYSGCEMEVLSRCRVKGAYKYTGVTLQSERITIKDEDDLYAQIPLGAAKLEGELAKKGQLDLDTAIVGTYDADAERVTQADLSGDCAKATHVLTSLTVGAFELSSGTAVTAGGGGTALGVGAGAKTRSERSLISRSGSADACKVAKTGDEQPPEGCGAFLRVEATTLAAAPAPIASPAAEPPPAAAPETQNEPAPAPAPDAETPTVGEPSEPSPSHELERGPPQGRNVHLGPGFLLGFRGPMAVHFGKLESGISLERTAPITGGGVIEIGYRMAPAIALAFDGTIFSGSSAASSTECPTGVKCKATIFGVGADAIVHPTERPGFWLAAGGDLSWVLVRRSGSFDDAGTQRELETARDFRALGPHVFVGADFVDSYVSQIQYGFMIGYMLRKTLSASGTSTRDGLPLPVGNADGLSHTIVFLGRFHFELGAKDADAQGQTSSRKGSRVRW